MSGAARWLALLRPLNVLLIAATPVALWTCLVRPLLGRTELDLRQVVLLGLAVALVAAGGNVVDDIADKTIDRLNGRDNPLLTGLSDRTAWVTYLGLNVGAGLLTWQLAAELGQWGYAWLLPVAVGTLAAYAFDLKCRPLFGNLAVAAFCAGVPGILILAEPLVLREIESPLSQSLLAYTALAFFGNFARELVKDLQDREGDAAAGCRPLAVVWPANRVLQLAGASLLGLLAAVAYLATVWYLTGDLITCLTWAALWLLVASMFYSLFGNRTSAQFAQLSRYLKLAMAFGLFALILVGMRVYT